MPQARVQRAADRIDELLAADLAREQRAPTELVDDATFARRAWLQVVGRIPNLEEIRAFLADATADKRARLVDQLLDSPGWTSNESNFWFDQLRVKSRQRQLSGEPFAHWIREALRTGMPYDEFVRAMLTADGAAHAEGNGATGYLLRDENMPHDAMANTLRLFLGTRVECAQCHNHPFDKWTQREFYGMAAFFGGLRYRVAVDRDVAVAMRRELQGLQGEDQRVAAGARRLLRQISTGLAGSGTGQERLPADYRYDDAKPRAAVAAAPLFGPQAKLPKPRPQRAAERPRRGRDSPAPANQEIDSRRVFADWLTDPRNPRFARTIANRLWQRTFGRGLIEPVDDLKDDSAAVHPKVLAHLEKLVVDLDYDLRQVQRVLLRTRLFQQQSLAEDVPAGADYLFRAPLLRRMTAEQLWDSLLTLVFADLDERLRPTDERAQEVYRRQRELTIGTPAEVAARLVEYGDPDRQRQLRQELLQQRREEQSARTDKLRALRRELAAARRRDDAAAVTRIRQELLALGAPRAGERAARGREGALQRASDLPQPAPVGHMLRQFGQSDRETVDGAALAATVPQALTLLNGPRSGGDSSLLTALRAASSAPDRVRTAFLAMLSRPPTAAEVTRWTGELQRGDEGLQDLVWVLSNCNEFRFRR
ncbi:MAG: DUF1549 domain-containing protein [Planctomycetota bacterium]